MPKPLYKVTFLNAGKVYELYARHVATGSLWGFTEVGDLVFDVHDGLVIDPTEERLRDEFGIYAVGTGRICVAALNQNNLEYVAKAVDTVAKG